MNAMIPVIPGEPYPVTIVTKGETTAPEFPAFVSPEGLVVSRWRLTWRERLCALLLGDLYVVNVTYGRKLQPFVLSLFTPTPQMIGPAHGTAPADRTERHR